MSTTYAFILIGAVFVSYAAVAILRHGHLKAKRQVRPPVELKLLRLPGESLRVKSEKLLERIMDWLMWGTLLSVALLIAPLTVLWHLYPKANLAATVVSCVALFAAGSVIVVMRVLALMKERGEVRLGLAGERSVAEELQPLMSLGYRVFHDVPLTRNDITTENLDHVAVGPHGLVVIETKTRSISTIPYAGKQEVTFDGERLIWPFYANDKSAVRQVSRCAEWLGKLVHDECGRDVPVHQIIAIPGWTVVPGKFYNPRVVSGSAVAGAFRSMIEGKPVILKPAEIKRIETKLGELCRDVEW